MKILTNPKLDEKEIKESIAYALDMKYRSLTCVIELSGRPIKTPKGFVLIPFKSPYYRRGMSDILFLHKGILFAFEVKTKEEYHWFSKKWPVIKNVGPKNEKEKHFFEQYMFITNIIKNGGHGGFIYNFEMAEKIIENALLDKNK